MLDVVRFRKNLGDLENREVMRLQKKSIVLSMFSISVTWGLIILAVYLTWHGSAFFLPVSLILIGSRQRALSNLVHDAAHGNLAKDRMINDRIANVFAAWPMGDTVSNYRKDHLQHHRYLGRPLLDPDFENHRRYGFDDLKPPRAEALKTYLKLLINKSAWSDSAMGSFLELSSREKFSIMTMVFVMGIGLSLFDSSLMFAVLGLWTLSRMTTYHAFRIFAEFLDHSGLKAGSVFGYTRNIPGGFWGLRSIFHPHADNFHLVHHLLPQVPHYRLKEAHCILMNNAQYKIAHHCDGYFLGHYSAVQSWATGARQL